MMYWITILLGIGGAMVFAAFGMWLGIVPGFFRDSALERAIRAVKRVWDNRFRNGESK